MATIVIYNTATNRVTQIIPSANTPDFNKRTDVVVIDKTRRDAFNALAAGVPFYHMKVDPSIKVGGMPVLEMTPVEKAAVDAERQAADDARKQAEIDALAVPNDVKIAALLKLAGITEAQLKAQIAADLGV